MTDCLLNIAHSAVHLKQDYLRNKVASNINISLFQNVVFMLEQEKKRGKNNNYLLIGKKGMFLIHYK